MAKKKKLVAVPTGKELASRYGSSLLLNAGEIEDKGLYIPSTMFALTYLMGNGIPYGRVVEIMGEENSGKSLAAMNLAYSTQQLGGHVIWVDAEQCWDNKWAEQNGIDPTRVTKVDATVIETISDISADLSIYWRSRLTSNEPILLVIDSIAALDCEESINSKMTDSKADMGTRAKALYKMFRIRNELWYKLGITVVCINQHRQKLGVMFGDSNTTPGGKALAFYASIRLAFFSGKTITVKYKSKDRKIGKHVTVRVMKNKVAPSRPTLSKAPLYFTSRYADKEIGFERLFGLEDVLIDNDIISKSNGGVYKYKGNVIARGEEKLMKELSNNDKLRKRLLSKAGIVTIGTMKKKLSELSNNLFSIEEDDTKYVSQADDSEVEYEENEE